ncbi:hypothetical protein D3C81_667840 [compost metagenome]
MDLGGAIGTFHLDMLHGQAVDLDRPAIALLPPEVGEGDQQGQQQQAEQAQQVARQAYRLSHTTEAVHGAAAGIGTGVLVESAHQLRLVHAEELGIGTHITTGEGMPRQLVEIALFQLAQGVLGQVQLSGHLGNRPALAFARKAQGFTGIRAARCNALWLRRHHHCSAWYA